MSPGLVSDQPLQAENGILLWFCALLGIWWYKDWVTQYSKEVRKVLGEHYPSYLLRLNFPTLIVAKKGLGVVFLMGRIHHLSFPIAIQLMHSLIPDYVM